MSLDGYGHDFGVALSKIAKSFERIADAQEQQAASLRLLAVNDTEKLARGLAATRQLQETHDLLAKSLRPSEPVEMD